ncbi:MAG: hypothetical protein LBP59_11215 [Planctomycetaceae bacterium]|jgi:hypothetical protein|nr:hypothetical protein [Planctomycetaceae bacterium]
MVEVKEIEKSEKIKDKKETPSNVTIVKMSDVNKTENNSIDNTPDNSDKLDKTESVKLDKPKRKQYETPVIESVTNAASDKKVDGAADSETGQLREAMLGVQLSNGIDKTKLLSTGSTLLNLAIANNWQASILPGAYYWLCGDSASGKTWLTYSILAEAANNPVYDNYRLIYDDVENGALFDVERYFGSKLARRCEPPAKDKDGTPIYSSLVEEFYSYLDDKIKQKKPFIYVLDSMDSLDSLANEKLFDSNKSAIQSMLSGKADKIDNGEKSDKIKASYGDGKAKFNSQNIRRFVSRLRKTGSILIIVTQTRDNITGYGAPKIAGGGKALKFYSHVELWTKSVGELTKNVNNIKRTVGSICEASIKKNRITGQYAKVNFNIHNTYGIDDLGSCIDYLLSEKAIETSGKNASGGTLTIPQMNLSGTKEKLITLIERSNREDEFRQLVADVWNDVLVKTTLQRKKRYE